MSFDLSYLLSLQEFRTAVNGAFSNFFLFLSEISYGVFIWMIACVLFWAVDKRSASASPSAAA